MNGSECVETKAIVRGPVYFAQGAECPRGWCAPSPRGARSRVHPGKQGYAKPSQHHDDAADHVLYGHHRGWHDFPDNCRGDRSICRGRLCPRLCHRWRPDGECRLADCTNCPCRSAGRCPDRPVQRPRNRQVRSACLCRNVGHDVHYPRAWRCLDERSVYLGIA